MTRAEAFSALLIAAFLGVLIFAGPALAYDEADPANTACTSCHGAPQVDNKGPHGGYTTTSTKCQVCHKVHAAPAGGVSLLPAATVKATCETCHDGTGGNGVYGVLQKRGVPAAAAHDIDQTNEVPGGNPSTGGTSTIEFTGQNRYLSCDDCHSPHDANTVEAFTGDRARSALSGSFVSNRLLKQRPGGATVAVARYGSDWCASCHAGRKSGTVVHNHPVDSLASTTTPFYYDYVARLASDDPTTTTVFGSLGRTNTGYLMPYPRTVQQRGHSPICQQCHEDARDVGAVSGATGDAAAFSITATDGVNPSDNPQFQTFPHEAANPSMLVETDDNLCTNCHDPSVQLN